MTDQKIEINCFPDTKGKIKIDNINVKYPFTFQESKNLRNWILDLRDQFCSRKSYINSSSNTIIISNIQYGNISIAFSWSKDTFDSIVSCSNNKNISENIKSFGMEKYSVIYNMNFEDYLKKDYLIKTPNSIILLDFVNSEFSCQIQS